MAKSPRDPEKLQDFARTGFPNYHRVEVRKERPAPSFWWLVLALGAGLALWVTLSPEAPGDEALAGVAPITTAPVPASDSRVLDPETWRGDISQLEDLLFSPPELDERGHSISRATDIRDSLDAWADRLASTGGDLEAQLARDLGTLRQPTHRLDFNVKSLATLRDSWLNVRDQHFDAAGWFQRDDPQQARTREFTVYRDAADNIRDLVQETMEEGESLADDDELSDAQRQQAWHDVLWQLGDDLKVLRASMPRRPPPGAERETLELIHQLDATFEAAGRLRRSEQALSRPLRRDAFEAVVERAETASEGFARGMWDGS